MLYGFVLGVLIGMFACVGGLYAITRPKVIAWLKKKTQERKNKKNA